MSPRPEFYASSEDLELAVQYVRELDFIHDENRQIAGNAYLAGMYVERARSLNSPPKKPITKGWAVLSWILKAPKYFASRS